MKIAVINYSQMNNKQQTDSSNEIYAVPELRSFLHDLANPLTIVQLNLDILKSDIYSRNKEEIDKIVRTALQGIEHANRMILSVRANTRPAEHKFEIGKELQNIFSIFADEYKNEGIILSLSTNSEKQLTGNLMDFRRVIINLIVNAADAVKQSKHPEKLIAVSTFKREKEYVIQVQDNGVGFNEKELKLLLLPGCTTKRNGDGLGLWIVAQTIHDKFSAKLTCSSTPGVGSIFSIHIPE